MNTENGGTTSWSSARRSNSKTDALERVPPACPDSSGLTLVELVASLLLASILLLAASRLMVDVFSAMHEVRLAAEVHRDSGFVPEVLQNGIQIGSRWCPGVRQARTVWLADPVPEVDDDIRYVLPDNTVHHWRVVNDRLYYHKEGETPAPGIDVTFIWNRIGRFEVWRKTQAGADLPEDRAVRVELMVEDEEDWRGEKRRIEMSMVLAARAAGQ